MKIVGFHWDHHSSVALLDDTEIRTCASEKRFTHVNNDSRTRPLVRTESPHGETNEAGNNAPRAFGGYRRSHRLHYS